MRIHVLPPLARGAAFLVIVGVGIAAGVALECADVVVFALLRIAGRSRQ